MQNNGKIIIVSGWRGSGKTTFCRKVIASAEKLRLAGSGGAFTGKV